MKFRLSGVNHPLHPALVHFPIACWSLATMGDIASIFLDDKTWWVSGVLLAIGSLLAIVTMITGMIDSLKIDVQSPAMTTLNLHVVLTMTSWCLYVTSLFLRVEENQLNCPNAVEIILSVGGFIFLCAAGWFGATLVYEHKIGIKK